MARFQRYVLFQLLAVFLIALTAITLLMVVIFLGMAVSKQGLGYGQTFLVLPYILPDALRFSIPATILFATCSVYGRMASSNEVVAIKSLGISPWSIIWPTLVLVALLSYTTVWLNDLAVSWGYNGLRRVVVESIEEVTYSVLKSQKSYSTDRFSINVQDVEGKRLIRPTVTFKSSNDAPEIWIHAEWAELQANLEDETLTIRFHNGRASGGDIEASFQKTLERVIPLSHASKKGDRSVSPSHVAMRDIPDRIEEQRNSNMQLEEDLAAKAALAMLGGNLQALGGKSWQQQQNNLVRGRQQLDHLHTEPHRRWANGFSCLCFVFIGAPLALRMRNAEFWTVFFVCFLPILLVYYPMLTVGTNQAKIGALPPESVWVGNVIMMFWGLWILRKVIRY